MKAASEKISTIAPEEASVVEAYISELSDQPRSVSQQTGRITMPGEVHRLTLDITEEGVEGVLGYTQHEDINLYHGLFVTKEEIKEQLEAPIPSNSSVKKEYQLALKGLARNIGCFFVFQEEAQPAFYGTPEHEEAARESKQMYIESARASFAKVLALGARMELRQRRCNTAKVTEVVNGANDSISLVSS